MSDETIITLTDGSKWNPSTSEDKLQCHHCDNLVDTPEEVASYPDGNCPDCGKAWTGETKRHTKITVTMPQAANGGTL
tara:strand:+ start:2345 stop:2578 length:234 start_codon:yes stop_codon:yes gene_type:complete